MSRLRPETLPLRVLDVVSKRRLWSPGQTVLVAVSGGLDSIVLLDVLCRTARAHGAHLSVQSLDHGLRSEARLDVELARAAAATHNLPFACSSLDLAEGPDLMARARAARHAVGLAPTDRVAQVTTPMTRQRRSFSASRGARVHAASQPCGPFMGACAVLLFERKHSDGLRPAARSCVAGRPRNPQTGRRAPCGPRGTGIGASWACGRPARSRLLQTEAFLGGRRCRQVWWDPPGLGRLHAEPRPLAAESCCGGSLPSHPLGAGALGPSFRGPRGPSSWGGWTVRLVRSVGTWPHRAPADLQLDRRYRIARGAVAGNPFPAAPCNQTAQQAARGADSPGPGPATIPARSLQCRCGGRSGRCR